MSDPQALNSQVAPYPAELAALVAECSYRPNWTVTMDWVERDKDLKTGAVLSEGLTVVIETSGFNSYHPERGPYYGVNHYFPVPPATYDRRSWTRWLFECFHKVELHEAMEFFTIAGEKPFAPNHGPGRDPYTVHELGTDTDARMSFRGVLNPERDFITPEPDEFKKM